MTDEMLENQGGSKMREYWMVQYSNGGPMGFKFCDQASEAEMYVRDYKRNGYQASCWKL